jgi:hypothetical protein
MLGQVAQKQVAREQGDSENRAMAKQTTLKSISTINQPGFRSRGHQEKGMNMFRRSLALLALAVFVSAAAATEAVACSGRASTCAPPAQVQIWGLSPSYGVNQGPVYSGPGYYTSPTYEGETSTIDYPYVGNSDYRPYGDYRRYDRPDAEHMPHRRPYPFWQGTLPERPRHLGMIHRHDVGDSYRRSGPRAITMSRAGHLRRDLRDPRFQ